MPTRQARGPPAVANDGADSDQDDEAAGTTYVALHGMTGRNSVYSGDSGHGAIVFQR